MKPFIRSAAAGLALSLAVAALAGDDPSKNEAAGSSVHVTKKKGSKFKTGSSEKQSFKQCSRCISGKKGDSAAGTSAVAREANVRTAVQ
jgi:hypothetical protein